MEDIGVEVSQKIKSAIKAKLKEIGVHVDEELPEYVMVMVANKRSKEQMDVDLQLFLGKHTPLFTTWLHQVLQKLQEVTVAKLDYQEQSSTNVNELVGIELYEIRQSGTKRKSLDERKSSDEQKKKKKTKQEEGKAIKKKIKEEPEDKGVPLKGKDSKKDEDNSELNVERELNSHAESSNNNQKRVSKSSPERSQDSIILKRAKQKEGSSDSSHDEEPKKRESSKDSRRKSLSISSQVDEVSQDIDDEDCINIRTDGELLDTAEDLNVEESSKKIEEKKDASSKKKTDKRKEKNTNRHINERIKEKPKSSSQNGLDKASGKEKPSSPIIRSYTPPPKTPPKTHEDKVIDARELLNRKKAAKEANSKARSRSRSRDRNRSLSPVHKKKEDEREARNYQQERGTHKRLRDDEKESSNRRHQRLEDRDRRGLRDRELQTRRRDDWPRKMEGDKVDQKNKDRRRESSVEPQSKRVLLDRTFKNKSDELSLKGQKSRLESPNKKEIEQEGIRRPGLVSRVVPRLQEPEEDTETPSGVPSVVKVTPRPRRPPSQQPSSSLIMRAISEANKSLATIPQRPDSTQLGRKKPVFARLHRQLKRIPPEKIAIEFKNPLALQTAGPLEVNEDGARSRSVSPIPKDKSGRNMSPPPQENFSKESTPSESEVCTAMITRKEMKVAEPNQNKRKELATREVEADDDIDLETSQEPFTEEPMEDAEPQFVVTLNGFDPDGIFSQSEPEEEEPLLTSTPDKVESPEPTREVNVSPTVVVGSAAVNHNNLIEVEILRSMAEKCKYWPACRLGDKCTYYHPTKPCKVFPNCKFGDTCLYIHPQCKFNALCTRKDCVFAHTSAYTPVQPTVVAAKAKMLYAASAAPCKFYPNCTNIHCQFSHPPRACRFGLYCTKKDCPFEHAQVASIDKLKWSRVISS